MSKRNVTLKLTSQREPMIVQTDARTFGELKAELKNVKWDGMRVVERSTKNTLQMDDAILPSVDFILFLVPEKVKSGASESKPDIENASYNELRSHISFLNKMKNANLSMDGKSDDLRKTLKKYYKKTETTDTEKTTEIDSNSNDAVTNIENSRKKINEAIDTIIENIKLTPSTAVEVDLEEYVVKLTVNDLEKELVEIKRTLKL